MKKFEETTIQKWAEDGCDTVALSLYQRLEPVEESGIIFPPTYADIGYCVDELADGTRIAQVDSVGSQANRMEPLFLSPEYQELVPRVRFELGGDESGEVRHVSLLELAHRAGDAVVRSTEMAGKVDEAFRRLANDGDATLLAKIAPTSLVFGAWDSRGTQVKRPRLVRAVIRAEDVQALHTAAQYNSVWKLLNEADRDALKKEAKKKKVKLSVQGFADAPSVGVPGGVIANGPIYRQVTINLIALRSLHGADEAATRRLRRYLLGLTLVAATADLELYLREGCLLRYAEEEDKWQAVRRRGKADDYLLAAEAGHKIIMEFARKSAQEFGVEKEERIYRFDIKKAKALLAKKEDLTEEV